MKKFITIAGNIGVGKSSLVQMLSQRLGWEPFFEPVSNNPYLADFYKDMKAWGFHSQVFFLSHRLRVYRELADCRSSVVLDRSLYEDAEIFAHNLYLQGIMSQRDFETYEALYRSLISFLPTPDLIIFLRASIDTLVGRIKKRDRDFEQTIRRDYLDNLNQAYDLWISNFSLCPVLTIPTDNLDFVSMPKHMDLIIQKVEEKISGKEEVKFFPEEY
ncbi:deoxynucleoside kinase [Patescibacteria group bacterium]|nr:deoxynucleoside kinase [Patescibacteria group bacterium]